MRKRGAIEAQIEVCVPFHDVDLAQVVWHGHYFKYLENARWAAMDQLGFGLETMRVSGYLWPIIDVQLRCVRAARFQDRLYVRASLTEWHSRLTFNYLITDARSGERVARARTTQVAVDTATRALQFVTPSVLSRLIEAHLARDISGELTMVQKGA
jgi:acyl-CoA thioester hydrolase